MKKVVMVIAVTFLLLLVGCKSQAKVDNFADCLTQNDVKMYGAYWCPFCAKQKEEFGDAFSKITYVECSLPGGEGQQDICKEKGITTYPTWEFKDGSMAIGIQPIEILSKVSGCDL